MSKFNKAKFKKWLIEEAKYQIYNITPGDKDVKIAYIKQLIDEDIGKDNNFFIDFNSSRNLVSGSG